MRACQNEPPLRKEGRFLIPSLCIKRKQRAALLPFYELFTNFQAQPVMAAASSREISVKLDRFLGKVTFTLLPVALISTATS